MRKRDHWIKIRVCRDEKQRWQSLAESQGLTLADFLRVAVGNAAMVGREPRRRRTGRKADPLLLSNIGRVGSNLNQIARWANTYEEKADAAQVLLALIAIEQLMLTHVREEKKGADRVD